MISLEKERGFPFKEGNKTERRKMI